MTLYTGKVEIGQGILTALQLLVAEELDQPLGGVRIHSASTARGPDEGMTSGSLSVQDSGGALRHAHLERVRGRGRGDRTGGGRRSRSPGGGGVVAAHGVGRCRKRKELRTRAFWGRKIFRFGTLSRPAARVFHHTTRCLQARGAAYSS